MTSLAIPAVTAAALTALWTQASEARVCLDDLDREAAAIVNSLNDRPVSPADVTKAKTLAAQPDAGFCLLYELARYLVSNSDNDTARQLLTRSVRVASDKNRAEFAPYNVIGFTYLAEKRFDEALENFSMQIDSPDFSNFPKDLQGKVWNNAGYTMIQMGRYSEAKEMLVRAQAAGNPNATRNLQALDSLVATLSSSDINLPGVFAAVVASAKSISAAQQEEAKAKKAIPAMAADIQIFKMGNGRYSITIGDYRSYPRAIKDRDAAIKAGIRDAYVTSLTDWELVQPKVE
jgi:tetratricopeptide (TPR) repeat protein